MRRKTSFYYSFLVLPPEQRRAIIATWDFCRAVDDAVDDAHASGDPASSGRDAVRFWRAELGRCFDGGTPVTLQGRSLQPYIARFTLPRDRFADVIDGVEMDIEHTRYETFEDVCEYCRRVASAGALICIMIFECRIEGPREYAINLGLALQITNILRDVSEDLARGRVYLPLGDLEACGCSVDDLRRGSANDAVRRVIRFESQRAHHFYTRAQDLLPEEERKRLVVTGIMRAVYFETLRRIEANGYDVLSARLRVPRHTQVFIALKQWLRSRWTRW